MTSNWYKQFLDDLQTRGDISPDSDRVAINFLRRKIIDVEEYNKIDNEAGEAKKRKVANKS